MPATKNEQPPAQDDRYSGPRLAVAAGVTPYGRGDAASSLSMVAEQSPAGSTMSPCGDGEPLKPLTPKTPLQAFHLARINATAYRTWEICRFKRCRAKKKCLGGPRGTFGRYGKPLCVVNGDVGR